MNTHFKKKSRNQRFRPNNNSHKQNRRGKKASTIDPKLLVNEASAVEPSESYQEATYAELPLHTALQSRIARKGFTHPTEIQHRTIHEQIRGRDVLGLAQTGSGKTAAFLIPIIHQLLTEEHKFKTLIVVPTRELALQVEQEFRSLTSGLKLNSTCLIGGTSVSKDVRTLQRSLDIVIGTPGRIMDLIQRRALRLKSFSKLILDEFDRMLDMGFVRDVRQIAMEMHKRNQTILFSATENPKQRAIINEFLNNPVEIRVISNFKNGDHINQEVRHISNQEDKFQVLLGLIGQQHFSKVLVFDETKRRVDRLTKRLRSSNIRVDQIHGDKSQNYRNKALKKFQQGSIQILVATDVAARGIDVDDVTHVINYQLPQDMDSYIHRIGRTGRAGKVGHAITFADSHAAA